MKKAADRFDQRLFIWEVEAAGIEPASRDAFTVTSTCVVSDLVVGSTGAPSRAPAVLIRERFLIQRVLDVTLDDPNFTPATR